MILAVWYFVYSWVVYSYFIYGIRVSNLCFYLYSIVFVVNLQVYAVYPAFTVAARPWAKLSSFRLSGVTSSTICKKLATTLVKCILWPSFSLRLSLSDPRSCLLTALVTISVIKVRPLDFYSQRFALTISCEMYLADVLDIFIIFWTLSSTVFILCFV